VQHWKPGIVPISPQICPTLHAIVEPSTAVSTAPQERSQKRGAAASTIVTSLPASVGAEPLGELLHPTRARKSTAVRIVEGYHRWPAHLRRLPALPSA